jgi:hypothetical protein
MSTATLRRTPPPGRLAQARVVVLLLALAGAAWAVRRSCGYRNPRVALPT